MEKFIFSIPDANSCSPVLNTVNVRLLNWSVLEAMKLHKEWFYDDFVIETAYGCPSSCKWNGNRYLEEMEEYDESWAKNVLGMYAEHGVKYRLTFTNFLLKPEHLRDPVGNAVAKAVSKAGGYVMVSTWLMAKHMARYPGLEVNWSTTTDFGKTTQKQIEKINQLSEKQLVVLPYEFNNKPELKQFTNPQNLEVLVNEPCIDNCPKRREHWTSVNKVILGHVGAKNIIAKLECYFAQQYVDGKRRKHHILRPMLKEYQEMGINHFKISGRVIPSLALGSYEHYFVKEENIPKFREFIDRFLMNFQTNLENDLASRGGSKNG